MTMKMVAEAKEEAQAQAQADEILKNLCPLFRVKSVFPQPTKHKN